MDRRRILVTDVPQDAVPISSVMLHALPRSILAYPVVFEGRVKAVLGLASLGEFAPSHLAFLEQLTSSMGIVVNSVEATMQTEGLLVQSQQLAAELQTQQGELQQTNEQLALKAKAARRAERRSRAQEQGDRARPPGARGEGRPSWR